jgi:hypothetical protein
MAGNDSKFMASASQKTNRQIRISFFNQPIDCKILIISLDGIPNFAFGIEQSFSADSLLSDEFIVYPNPTSDFISVVLPTIQRDINYLQYCGDGSKLL